uniref:Dynactin subunit 4 n=1 Tax=Aceria tosichella TaxID=561515 RepID=A0A6G1S8C0_9ACAR
MSRVGVHSRQQQQQQSAANPIATLSEYRPGAANNPNYEPYKLDFLFSNDLVQYKCSCGEYRRLNNTYFCRHCMAIRCRSCVAHEVDSQYCQHCLEYIPTIDPKFQMNKCASCYQCPSCQHLLSTSVLSVSPSPSDLQAPSPTPVDEIVRKTCQLVCEFCRWSSETFVTEGSRLANNLADFEIPEIDRISELISFYKAISQKEKTDKKKRRFHARSGNTMDLLKKYGIDNTLSPKLFESLRARTTFQDKSGMTSKYNLEAKSAEESAIELFKPAEARNPDDLDKLDTDFYYNKEFDVGAISSIAQRLAQVEIQPEKVADFKPISKSLSVKRSLRCKECERNLCRSEYSPISIRFKIQSAAYYHVPEVRLRSDSYPIKLKLNDANIIEFSVQNQTLSQVKLKFERLESEIDEHCDIVLPPPELSLGPKDDTADYEHVPLQIRPLNEETHITFQSPFKIGFFIKIVPKKKVDLLAITFAMSHDILLIQNPKENERVKVTHNVRVNLGPVE